MPPAAAGLGVGSSLAPGVAGVLRRVKRISDESGFSGLTARLFKLLGLVAYSGEDRVAVAAIKAAGALCDFGSADRAGCLAAMAAIGTAGQPSICTVVLALEVSTRLGGMSRGERCAERSGPLTIVSSPACPIKQALDI